MSEAVEKKKRQQFERDLRLLAEKHGYEISYHCRYCENSVEMLDEVTEATFVTFTQEIL